MSVSPQAASYALTVEFTKCSVRAPGEMLSRDDTRLVYTPWLDREMRTFLVDYGRCRHSFHSSGLRANISSDGYLKALGRLVVDAAGRRVAKPGLPFLGITGVLRSTPPDLEERRLAAHAVWSAYEQNDSREALGEPPHAHAHGSDISSLWWGPRAYIRQTRGESASPQKRKRCD